MIIGIDLGTTNSLAACYTEDGPVIIPNRRGERLTPSVVAVGEAGELLVGEPARQQRLIHPERAADVFKRSMGTDRIYRLGEKTCRAAELSALVLRTLKEDAEAYLKAPVDEAVISVPAYFNNIRREAVKRAGELAGFRVERIISEPTAAAVAYGLYEGKQEAKFLVFDLGGGTFDVSILERFGTILEVHAVAGDNFLGGEDFTGVLEELFYKENGIKAEELDPKTRAAIHEKMEQCKLGFSQNRISGATVWIQEHCFEFSLSLQAYEKACEPLLDRIRRPVRKSLSDAGIRSSDLDVIVPVGGATRLPIVRSFITRLFHRFIDAKINPDEAVALGAAVHAAMKERKAPVREIILTDVCPFTLGTEVLHRDERTGEYETGFFCPIIERNTVIPVSRTERFYTASDNQREFLIHILQGESRYAANNISLGELRVAVPPQRAGEEGIDVTFTYDVNSLLEVEVTILSTGEKKKQWIQGADTAMSEEEIRARMEELSFLKTPPREQEANKQLLQSCEQFYEESVGEARRRMDQEIQRFESVLKSRNASEIQKAREALRLTLEAMTKEREG